MKAFTVRLDDNLADEVDAVARAEGRPLAEVFRDAVHAYVKTRRKDPAFQAELRKVLERERGVLERLSSEEQLADYRQRHGEYERQRYGQD